MIHSRPCRSSSSDDGVSRAAQRLGRALRDADITEPFRYQRLQQEALAFAAKGGGMPLGKLNEKGMNLVAAYIENAVA
jgi:hypothetical protein